MAFGLLGKIGELREMRVESESGFSCLEWRIPDIHSLPAASCSHYKSDSFQFLGESWHMRLSPRTRFITVVLVKEASAAECSVKYSLHFKMAGDTLPNEFTAGSNYIFEAGEDESSSIAALRSELEWKLAHSGVATIVCLLKKLAPYPVTPESRVVQVTEGLKKRKKSYNFVEASTAPQSKFSSAKKRKESSDFVETSTHEQSKFCCEKLSLDLNELMLSGKCSDFTVQVKGEEFRLHRAILSARSPVFQSMFEHDMAETKTGRVSVDDCEVDVFRAFVRYVYTGKTDQLHADFVFGLFALADKYQVDELKSACLAFILSTLSVETLCDVVQLALTYDDKELLEQATEFLSDKTTKVMKTVKWKNFLTANPMRANDLLMKALDRKKR